MKHAAWGAVAAVAALVAAFWVGRWTVPDRSAEVEGWRRQAEAALADTAAARERADSAEARARRIEVRADTVARALARVQASDARRAQTILTLRDSMVSAASAADTIALQYTIIAQQDTTILGLRAGLSDAWDALAGLRADLGAARETLATQRAESDRLRALIAAGLDATRPSRGRSSALKTLALGVAVGVIGWEVAR